MPILERNKGPVYNTQFNTHGAYIQIVENVLYNFVYTCCYICIKVVKKSLKKLFYALL